MSVDSRPPGPRNVKVLSSYLVDALDVHWDDICVNAGARVHNIWTDRQTLGAAEKGDFGHTLPANFDFSQFEVLGHRVYRSDESPTHGFRLVSGELLPARAFRDRTTIREIHQEDVTNRFTSRGTDERGEWRFIVRNTPIAVRRSQLRASYNPEDVKVEIAVNQGDGSPPKVVQVPVTKVNGDTGEITINHRKWLDLETNREMDPILPDLSDNPSSGVVFCSYPFGESLVQTAFNRAYYYRVTTVARRLSDDKIVETPLTETEVASSLQLDGNDYIWNEANRRNRWLLEQAGESVLFFLRKRSGPLCHCFDPTHQRGRTDCPDCFGTQYRGGYEGPFEVYTTPFEGQKSVEFTEMGLTMNISYEITILDPFLISSGDLMIRQDGQRYLIGSVTPHGARGTIRVQQATVTRLPESDYRQNVPVHPTQTKLSGPLLVDNGRMPGEDKPILTDTTEADQREIKGHSITFENIMQGR